MASKRVTSNQTARSSKGVRKINKSAWIRSQPADMPAAKMIEKAKAEGFTLSAAQVYTTRTLAKKRAGQAGAGSGGAASPTTSSRAASSTRQAEFRQLVLHIGIDRAEALLAGLKREFDV